jgi:D-amino peptidase
MSHPALPQPTVISPATGAQAAPGAKFYVRCDVEGASAVVSPEQAAGSEREFGRRMIMADLKALVEGLRKGGASEVLVYDAHDRGITLDAAELPPGVMLISGRPPLRPDWAGGLDDSFTGLILLGAHASAGSETALMPHTYDPDILALRLNGLEVGEIGLEAAVAGECGVPLLMITGDGSAVAEGCALAPHALGVVVKDAVDRQGALCFSLEVTTDLIRRAAQQLAREPGKAAPFVVEPPVTLEAELAPGALLDRMRELYPRDVKSERRVRLKADTVTAAWAAFQGRWLRARGVRRS